MKNDITIEYSKVSYSKDEDKIFSSMQESLDQVCKNATNLYNLWIKEKDKNQRLIIENELLKKELNKINSSRLKDYSYDQLFSKIRELRNEKSKLEAKIDELGAFIENQIDDLK